MKISIDVPVHAPRHEVWIAVTDIENAANRVSGIEEVRVLERPESGLVGLKWKETRTLFGKTATETMWITDAVDNEYYLTEARSHGTVYTGKIYLEDRGDVTQLGMHFVASPETMTAKILSAVTGVLFRGATRKALLQDLQDVKASCEHGDSSSTAEPIRS